VTHNQNSNHSVRKDPEVTQMMKIVDYLPKNIYYNNGEGFKERQEKIVK
jgi:hypothetical protein